MHTDLLKMFRNASALVIQTAMIRGRIILSLLYKKLPAIRLINTVFILKSYPENYVSDYGNIPQDDIKTSLIIF